MDEEKRKEAWDGGKLSILAEKMEACLSESKYSCGDEITWADFSIWGILFFFQVVQFLFGTLPTISKKKNL